MVANTLHLEGTELVLNENSVLINDNFQKTKRNTLLMSCFWVLFGLIYIWKYYNEQEDYLLWIGLLVGISHMIALLLMLRRSTESEIALTYIKRVKFSANMLGEESMTLYLHNDLQRKVKAIAPVSNELRAYFEEKGIGE